MKRRAKPTIDRSATIAALLNAAVAAHAGGDRSRAQALCGDALRIDAHNFDAVHVAGILAQQAGDLARARTLLERAVALRPGEARAHYNLGIVRAALDDIAGAIAAYENAVARDPGFANAHSNAGNLYLRCGRTDDALRAYWAAIHAKPDFGTVYCNLGALLVELERFDEAVTVLETAARLSPELPDVYGNLGRAHRRAGRKRESMAAMQRALELRPDPALYLDLSLTAFELGAFDIALDANLRALELDPASPQALCNCATVYLTTGRYREAALAGEAAIRSSPDFVGAHVNLGLASLVQGDFARGWDEFAWSWRLPERRPSYPYIAERAPWNGEPFAGRRLFVTREQGFGDAIMAVRYLPAVKALGGEVILEAAPALVPLFADLPGVDELRAAEVGTTWDDLDLYIPVLGLPRAFRTDLASIPAGVPYLRAPAERLERWRGRLTRPGQLRVGIVWSGSPAHVADRQRSARLDDVAPLGEIAGVAWFGLQKGRDEDCRAAGALVLDPLGAEIADFADSAAIVSQLDLVIAVDTAIVHLAGALAKPVWTLLPFAPDWRWLLERPDSPWYPTMRLFRQPAPGDWSTVFAAVARELRRLLAA